MTLDAAYRAEHSVQAWQLCWPCINAWTWPFGWIPDAYAAASSPMSSSDEIVAQLSSVWTREGSHEDVMKQICCCETSGRSGHYGDKLQ
ncbi:hypothetical protein PG995_015228 [Apiospora arundinis]|uniref:Uncharacterized protein n=1 Tax=Apiospora arundinis TaxID=335852 RepID=A0ABR2IFY3_9PEZI